MVLDVILWLNLWMGRIAPWFWLSTSIYAAGINYRCWNLCRIYESRRTSPVTRTAKLTTGILMRLAAAMSVVGAFSIYTWFKYPILRANRAVDIPLDLALQSCITIVVLLSIPVVCAVIGLRKWNYLLNDTFEESPKPSSRKRATGVPPAKRRSR